MFTLNEDKSIYATRGDIVFFSVTAEDEGESYQFKAGDVVRIKIYGKKNAEDVVLEKDFPVTEECTEVEIYLDKEDTKIGEVISKPKDYWYEVELNPYTEPQTIIGYDEDGPKVFKLFPEGADIPAFEPTPEDIPFLDDELDLVSTRPVQNQAVARAVVSLRADFESTREDITKKSSDTASVAAAAKNEVSVERARIDNLIAHENGVKLTKTLDYLESVSENTKAKIDGVIDSDGVFATITVNLREANLIYGGSKIDIFTIPDECRPISVGLIHAGDGLEYRINYDTTNNYYYLFIKAQDSVTVAPSGAGSVSMTYALGDYEISDVRIGVDGTTYKSAGAAVRGQVEKINKRISTIRGYGFMAEGELHIDTMNKTIHSQKLLLLTSDRTFAYVTNDPIALDDEDASLRSIFAVLRDDGSYELHLGREADMNNFKNVYYICGYYSGELVGSNFSPNLSVTINGVTHAAYEVTMNGYYDNLEAKQKEQDENLNASNQRLIDFVYNISSVNENVVEFKSNHLTALNVSTDGSGELGEGEKTTRLSVREMIPSYNTEEIEIELAQATTYACNLYLFDENKTFVSSTYHSGKNGIITAPIDAAYFRVMIARSSGNTDIPATDLVKIRLYSKKRKVSIDSIPDMLVSAGTTHIKLFGDSITQGMGSTGYVGYTITENGTSISVRGNGPDYASKGDDYVEGDYLGEIGARRWYESTSSTGWSNKLKDYLESKFDCVVKNYGMSGIASGNLYELCKPLVSEDDDIIVLMIGTNDRANTAKDDFKSNVRTFVEHLISQNKKVVLMGSTPVSVDNESGLDFHMEDVNNILRSVAYSCGVEFIPIYDCFTEYCDIKDIDVDSMLKDGLHPNDSGYDVMFKIICKHLGVSLKRTGATW